MVAWKRTLTDLEKAPDVAYQDILNEFGSTLRVKGLIVTRRNLVVKWKVRSHLGIISWFPLGVHWFSWDSCVLVPFLQLIFSVCARKINKRYLNGCFATLHSLTTLNTWNLSILLVGMRICMVLKCMSALQRFWIFKYLYIDHPVLI